LSNATIQDGNSNSENANELAATIRGSWPGGAIRIAHYDVIYDVIISVQDGNCKKMARENFSIDAFYNITKNQDNPMKTVVRDSF